VYNICNSDIHENHTRGKQDLHKFHLVILQVLKKSVMNMGLKFYNRMPNKTRELGNYLYIQPNALYYFKLKNYLQYITLIQYKLSLVFKIWLDVKVIEQKCTEFMALKELGNFKSFQRGLNIFFFIESYILFPTRIFKL
jgi:hypothetical protein